MKMFPLPIPAGKKVVIRTTSTADVDLYIQFGAEPTTTAYLARGYTSSGNETVTYTATSNGTLYVGVHGYAAGNFTVKSADQ
jgi:Bacterial pre-peptidase C-terminal domain